MVNPSVEVYLTPQRFSFTGAIRLKTVRFRMTARSLETWHLQLGSRSVRAGTYYLAFYIRDGRDGHQANNAAWSLYDATVTVRR